MYHIPAATKTVQRALQTCQECGELQCLCRPRFFAGQLLTEADLNALEQYIIQKDRLHNRYLHGTGVVCGLEVAGHPCKGWVTIKSGYAIGPCGEDIIVCEDNFFDLCAKIRECRDRPRQDLDCDPIVTLPEDRRDAETCWYVTIRYNETESRGITALKGSGYATGCHQCKCNPDSCSGSCGCHRTCHTSRSNGHGSTTSATSARRPPLQCEPTRICEGYVVEVAPAPLRDIKTNADLFRGTLAGGLAQHVRMVGNVAQKEPRLNDLGTTEAIYRACCQFKQDVLELLGSDPPTRYELLNELRAADFRHPRAGEGVIEYREAMRPALERVAAVPVAYLGSRLCSNQLPPCPDDPGDARVILACVTVRGEDCHVVDICNLRGRQQVWTWPNVLHWFPIFRIFQQFLQMRCCGPREVETIGLAPLLSRARLFTAPPDEEADMSVLLRTLLRLFAQGVEGMAYGDPARSSTFERHVGGSAETVGESLRGEMERPPLRVDTEDVNWPLEIWALHQLLQPFIAFGEDRVVTYRSGTTVMGFGASSLADLRNEVARLSGLVEELQQQLG